VGQRLCGGWCIATDACCTDADCAVPNGTRPCIAGRCGELTCAADHADCKPDLPGCETRLGTTQNCARCGDFCQDAFSCEARTCRCSQTVCGASCVDLRTSASHCGTCRRECPGACAASSCTCVQPNPGNLVVNGGFDRNSDGWGIINVASNRILEEDGGGCSGSRSLLINVQAPNAAHISRCITNVDVNARYRVGGWIRVDPASTVTGSSTVTAQWIPRANCEIGDGSGITYTDAQLPEDAAAGVWTHVTAEGLPPENARSVLVIFGSQTKPGVNSGRLSAAYDMIYLSISPRGWN
jgi:hypothetical protein